MMQRLFFYTKLVLSVTFIALLLPSMELPQAKKVPGYYQLTVYKYSNSRQEEALDTYLKNALLPALHRNGIANAGVFKAVANDTAAVKTIYVLLPAKKLETFVSLQQKLAADNEYLAAGADYINADYKSPCYDRMEVIMLKAFSLAPLLQVPQLTAAKKDRIYELRSYESTSETIFKNKVHMFNEGDEIGIFKKLNFNAVFYSEVLSGGKMPNLMYMTSYENMDDRNAHWKAFGNDTSWKKLSAMPEYQNNVSHIDITFLRGVEYSDF
jgi:hypothetical protein